MKNRGLPSQIWMAIQEMTKLSIGILYGHISILVCHAWWFGVLGIPIPTDFRFFSKGLKVHHQLVAGTRARRQFRMVGTFGPA